MAADPMVTSVLTPRRAWTTVHDTVMGGVSEGRVIPLGDGAIRFEGVVSLENNGGFASARTAPAALGLEGISAFRLELRGDGRIWSFTVRRDDVRISAGSWRAELRTTGERQIVELPISAFEAVSKGRRIPTAPSLVGATGHVDSVGFLVGSGQEGPFALEVYRIEGTR